MNILEYSKTILRKVSFDKELLKKELEKAIQNIRSEDRTILLEWFHKELVDNIPANNLQPLLSTQDNHLKNKS